jgi:hypothetical protein
MLDNTTLLFLLAGLAVLLALLLGVALFRAARRRDLQRSFGPEYAHAVDATGSRTAAERELGERRKRVEHYPLRELAHDERRDLGARWRALQVDFVDRPKQAVEGADRLVAEAMSLRGYPPADFDQRLADTSVSYPEMAADYRDARAVAEHSRQGLGTTEDLRRAMVCYRNLFTALLGPEEVPAPVDPALAGGRPPVARH